MRVVARNNLPRWPFAYEGDAARAWTTALGTCVTLRGGLRPTQTGAPTSGGELGHHPVLNGTSQYYSVGDETFYDFGAGDYSIEGWIVPYTISDAKRMMVIAKDDVAGRQFSIEVNGNGASTTRGALRIGYFVAGANVRADSPVDSLVQGRAHHFVAQRVGNGFEIYIDGVNRSLSLAGSHGTMSATSASTEIGRRTYAGNNDFFHGSIPFLSVRTRAISAAEAWKLYDPATRWNDYIESGRVTYFIPAAAPSGFQAAWARNRSAVIGAGIH